jgi:hypothetical protein
MMTKRAKVLANYYDYNRVMPLVCPVCGWSGSAGAAETEWHRDLLDISCPKCGKMLLVVPYPTFEQVKVAAAAGNEAASAQLAVVERQEGRLRDFEKKKLASPNQLPQLDGDELEFIWESEGDRPNGHLTIKVCDRVVGREPEFYECWPRFNEIKTILVARYGRRFKSMTPTEPSLLYLYGDDASAPSMISFGADTP